MALITRSRLRLAALAAGAVALALLGALLCRPRPSSSTSPSALATTAQAYRSLGLALEQAGLLPFPADLATLQGAALFHGQPGPQLAFTPTTDSNGQPVYQFGSALTVMTLAGRPVRYLLSTDHAPDLEPAPLGEALAQLGRLSLSSQQAAQVSASAGAQVQSQGFYFEYTAAGHSWRLSPQFSGERCVRVDVTAQ